MYETIQWLTAAGADAVSIAGTTDAIVDFRVNGQQSVQVLQAIRAASAQPVNRRGVSVRVSFLITYAPAATAVAAKTAIATRTAALVAATATRELLQGVFSTLTWQLADAALASWEFEQQGLTIRARYEFLGGAFTSV